MFCSRLIHRKSGLDAIWFRPYEKGMSKSEIVVVGGGAAGFFGALACAEAAPKAHVSILEQSGEFLAKVRVSGGGRCNVTHACFDPRELASHYPRGSKALIGPFHRFQPRDTIAWFEQRGVKLKTEPDGRMFPMTNTSETIIDCFMREAQKAEITLQARTGVEEISKRVGGGFDLGVSGGRKITCDSLLLATGGCRAAAQGGLAQALGHSLEPPVPSLFSFELDASHLHDLAGVAVSDVLVSVPGTSLSERGPVLITHSGMSGPVILRLSAWGARIMFDRGYKFTLAIHWLPSMEEGAILKEMNERREKQGARLVANAPIGPLPGRLWERLVQWAGLNPETRWSSITRAGQQKLLQQLTHAELPVTGKSLNKDEFVTCGGVRLDEVQFKTMESRICPGLYLAGELLDIDGITGGFNFQAAWTTGWIAGQAMAESIKKA